jgi:hypothetical protein
MLHLLLSILRLLLQRVQPFLKGEKVEPGVAPHQEGGDAEGSDAGGDSVTVRLSRFPV